MVATVTKLAGSMPARQEPDDSYRGRVTRHWSKLRDGRDVKDIVKAVKRYGYTRVSVSTYYNWEAGTTDPPLSALPALAKALGAKDVHGLLPPR